MPEKYFIPFFFGGGGHVPVSAPSRLLRLCFGGQKSGSPTARSNGEHMLNIRRTKYIKIQNTKINASFNAAFNQTRELELN